MYLVMRTEAVAEPVIDEETGEEHIPWSVGDKVEVFELSEPEPQPDDLWKAFSIPHGTLRIED
jgi:hypothetical protein